MRFIDDSDMYIWPVYKSGKCKKTIVSYLFSHGGALTASVKGS